MNQPSTFRMRNWVEINDESKRKYNNSNIRFKAFMKKSNLCDIVMRTYLLRVP